MFKKYSSSSLAVSVRLLLAAMVVFASTVAAHADTVSANAVSTFTLIPASDTLTINAASSTVSVPGTFTQTGVFYVGNSPIPNQTVSFNFTDVVTVDGITKNLVFTGDDIVTTGPDTLVINALAPTIFGDVSLSFASFSIEGSGEVGQSLPVTLTGSLAATPEPSSFILLGTGLFGAAGFIRRKLIA